MDNISLGHMKMNIIHILYSILSCTAGNENTNLQAKDEITKMRRKYASWETTRKKNAVALDKNYII